MSYQPNRGGARRGSRSSRAAWLGVVVVAAWTAAVRAQGQEVAGAGPADSSGILSGSLTGAEAGESIPYATITLNRDQRESFADAAGGFRMARLAPGTYTLRARQIGYAPLDTTVTVEPGPIETTVSLHLHRVALRLAEVAVHGRAPKGCVATGVPDSTINPALATIFAQVRENVDRFRLLLDKYPFEFTREERRVLRRDPGGDSTIAVDTVGYESRAGRPYRVGGMIYDQFDPLGRRARYMYLPTFRDLADPAFLSAHCFTYAGTRRLGGPDGAKVLRIDFRPANRIATPDVEGSIYLDASRFIVRRAVFRMTKPGAANPPVLGLTVTTTFKELVPLVPVFDSVETDQPLPLVANATSYGVDTQDRTILQTSIEEDRLLSFTFEQRTPGQQNAPAGAPLGEVPTVAARRAPPLPAAAAPSAPTLTGRVVQGDGTPVAGATVAVFGARDSASTSDSGRFTLSGLTAGPHMLSVRRLGFDPVRLPVTVSREPDRAITVALARTVPVLPTVTTTAEKRAYHDIGLDRRMQSGVGQYLTYEQIQRRNATKLSQLLANLRGIHVRLAPKNFNSTVEGTRGVASCVGYVIDGVPQTQLASQSIMGSVLAPADADNLIEPSEIGAVEVYTPSERPVEFGAGLADRPSTLGGAAAPTIDLQGQQCSLVVIWTRARLGLPEGEEPTGAQAETGPRATPVFPDVTSCEPRAADDTIVSAMYASLEAAGEHAPTDAAWSAYVRAVLAAVRAAFVMPTALPLAAFDYSFSQAASGSTAGERSRSSLAAAPGFSTVVTFMLDARGVVHGLRVGASSLSGVADTSVLAAVSAADAAHTFPPAPPGASGLTRFDLVVSTKRPGLEGATAVLGSFFAPMWTLRRQASLAAGAQPSLASDTDPTRMGTDSVTLEFVVDERGHAAMPTVRALAGGSSASGGEPDPAFLARVVHALPGFHFQSAEIGACPVRQIMTAGFSLHGVVGALPTLR